MNAKELHGISLPVGIYLIEMAEEISDIFSDEPKKFNPVTAMSDVPTGISTDPTIEIGRLMTSVFAMNICAGSLSDSMLRLPNCTDNIFSVFASVAPEKEILTFA